MTSIVFDGPYTITQPWGWTDVDVEPLYTYAGRTGHWHCGIDLATPLCYHKPFRAARSGVVTALGRGFLSVAVNDGSGETDWYVHGEYEVALGQVVAQGEELGLISNIVPAGGASTGAHLHFERQGPGGGLNRPGTSRDPLPVLAPALYGAASSASAGGFGSMTDQQILDQFQAVSNKQSVIGGALQAQGNVIIGLIKGLPAAGASVDLSAELTALATANGKLDQLLADEAALKAKLDKDLA